MFRYTSSLKLFGAVVGSVVLASQACALGGAVPLLISKPDYENNYVSSPVAVVQNSSGSYALTADGYPVVWDASGHWVYLCTCDRHVVVHGSPVTPVAAASPAVVIVPQQAFSPVPQSVVSPGQSNLSPVLGTPSMVSSKTNVKAPPKKAQTKSKPKSKPKPAPRPQQKHEQEPEKHPKKIIIHGTPEPPAEPVVEPVVPQSGDDVKSGDDPKAEPLAQAYLPPPPNRYEILAPDPSVMQAPESEQPQMIIIRPQ